MTRPIPCFLLALTLIAGCSSSDDPAPTDGATSDIPVTDATSTDTGATDAPAADLPAMDSAAVDLPAADSTPVTLAKIDERCDAPGTQCEAGLQCMALGDAGEAMCVPTVPSCGAGVCAAGRVCVATSSGGGVCLLDCTASPALCAAAGTECTALPIGKKVCLPRDYGPRTFGEVCSNTAVLTDGCIKGLECMVKDPTATSGFCTEDCTVSGTCPVYSGSAGTIPATCLDLSATKKICVFPCGQPGQTCPTGLVCTTLSGGSICLAP